MISRYLKLCKAISLVEIVNGDGLDQTVLQLRGLFF